MIGTDFFYTRRGVHYKKLLEIMMFKVYRGIRKQQKGRGGRGSGEKTANSEAQGKYPLRIIIFLSLKRRKKLEDKSKKIKCL